MGDDLRCGFCLEKLTSAVDAKQLPCSHVYCISCLESDEEKVCPACRRSWSGVALGELRSYPHDVGAHGGSAKGISCDLCKSGVKRPSTVYCVSCSQTFCQEHEMKHDDLFDLDHDKVSISSYLSSPARYKKTKCPEHQSEITVACGHCHLVFCGKCDLNAECKVEPQVSTKKKATISKTKYVAGENFFKISERPKINFQSSLSTKNFEPRKAEDLVPKPAPVKSASVTKSEKNVGGLFGAATNDHKAGWSFTPTKLDTEKSAFNMKPATEVPSSGRAFARPKTTVPTSVATTASGANALGSVSSSTAAFAFAMADFSDKIAENLVTSPPQNKYKFSAKTSTGGLFGSTTATQKPGGFPFGAPAPNFSFSPQKKVKALTVGTNCEKFSPVFGTDNMVRSGVTTQVKTKHFCITSMKQYKTFSLEELRVGDYEANPWRFPQSDPSTSLQKLKLSSPFGGNSMHVPGGQNEGKKLHKFVDVAQFTAKIEEELRKKLDILSDKRTDIYKAEKRTWREIDNTESRVERWKGQVDDIIRQKMSHLSMMGDQFKKELDRYSAHVGDEAAVFMTELIAEEDQLMGVEREISEALSMETDVTKLVKVHKSHPTELTPTAEFSVQQNSITLTGYQPAFSLTSFSPTSLEYKWKKATAESIAFLAAMGDGNILVGTASNHLEIRNLHFHVLFQEKVPGQLHDVAALNSNVVCLLSNGKRFTIYLLSNQLKNAKVVCDWLTTKPCQKHLAGLGNTLVASDGDLAKWYVCGTQEHGQKSVTENERTVYSLCVKDKTSVLALTSEGIELFIFGPFHGWIKIADLEGNTISDFSPGKRPEKLSPMSSAEENTHCLSKTRDHSNFFYICWKNKISALNRQGSKYELTHPKLSSVKRVTAIAACGSHLVVGCGEDGLKLFSIV